MVSKVGFHIQICCCSDTQLCLTLCDPKDCSTPGFPISWSLHKLMFTDLVKPSNHLILCRPLLLLPSMSQFFTLSGQSPGASASVIPMNIQGQFPLGLLIWSPCTLKSLLQHHSSKASILWCSAFFMVQVSRPYMATGKMIALTRRTFVGKVMSLLFNMLSRLFIAFLPRSKRLLISWLQSMSPLIWSPRIISTLNEMFKISKNSTTSCSSHREFYPFNFISKDNMSPV